MKKIILRIKGGLGNQMFSYAAAKSLAILNNAELVIDDTTGFERDKYNRTYCLDNFNISSRRATEAEKLQPLSRLKRSILKLNSSLGIFSKWKYFFQKSIEYDETFLKLKFDHILFLEGYWQSESYFLNIDKLIRNEFVAVIPSEQDILDLTSKIKSLNSVCLHVRWFDAPDKKSQVNNLSIDYYLKAIQYFKKHIPDCHFFIFSEFPDVTRTFLSCISDESTIIYKTDKVNPHNDLLLMTLCRHFIIANSTFSWWAAWLGDSTDKIVVAPGVQMNRESSWGFDGLIPKNWIVIE
jgi:hypothetical protein